MSATCPPVALATRYLTPFRAEWDPKDTTENVFVVGRYISEDFGGTALHPVDIMHAGTGQLLHQLTDFNLTTICPVNKPHPRRDVIVTGSSGSLYLWTPAKDDDALDAAVEAADGGGAALPGGSGGGQGAASKVPSAADLLRRVSANFVYFDADPDSAAAKKKRRASGGNATTTTATKKGGKRPPAAADDDSDDD